jgi:hypothetical protein
MSKEWTKTDAFAYSGAHGFRGGVGRRVLPTHPAEFGDFIQEAFVFSAHLVPSTQSSTSAERGRSVNYLAIC